MRPEFGAIDGARRLRTPYPHSRMASHWNGPDREKRALDAYVVLVRAAAIVNARLHGPLATDHRLTMGQLGVLETLHHLGPMSQSALAGRLLISASNLTTVLDNLERDRLVQRVRDAVDRRISNVHLTEAGAERIAATLPAHVDRVAEAMAGLAPDEQAELLRLCRKLGVTANGGDPAAADAAP